MREIDFLVLYEHPEWQRPLFDVLEARGHSWAAFDLKSAAFDPAALPAAQLVFNQASPSAYVRGNGRAIPHALTLLRTFEAAGMPVLNGHRAFALELSKAAQLALLRRLGIRGPRTLVFHDVDGLEAALAAQETPFPFPALIKPDQGGSGARMHRVESLEDVREVVRTHPDLFTPDPVLLLQELLDYDPAQGIVRMEFLGGELLYAMRVVSNGAFNLCPSEVCHPVDGAEGVCAVPAGPKVEFFDFPEVPAEAVEAGRRIVAAGGLDVGGLEYAWVDGKPVFYDVNANSNLRPAIAEAHGFDPFERVVDYLESQLRRTLARAAE
ncbi:MAG: hypothetical protein AAGH15_10565 [Myxococcota bacterium]